MKKRPGIGVRQWIVWTLGSAGMLLFLGCVSVADRDRPFTDAWAAQQRSNRAFEERQKRIRGDEGIPLFGCSPRKKAALRMDERGNPKLDIGGDTGLSVDLNYGSRTEAQIKYKLEWDHGGAGGCRKRPANIRTTTQG